MDSDFFTDGYADRKAIEEIAHRLEALRHELTHGYDESTGRSDHDIRKEIEELEAKREELMLKLEHEEKAQH